MTDWAGSRHAFITYPADGVSSYRIWKRIIDVLGASLLLLLGSPFLLLIAVAIKLESTGPVIFKQERIGGRRVRSDAGWEWRIEPFVFYKFRTMSNGASHHLHKDYIAGYINGDEEEMAAKSQGAKADDSYKLINDPRVTRVGRVLRTLSLDEIPQLWNVLKGDMSLVGPRPPISYEVEMYREEHFRRLAAMPGITGLWQVSGRSEIGFDDMVRLDLDYINSRSLLLDLKILLLTVPAVVSRRGAG